MKGGPACALHERVFATGGMLCDPPGVRPAAILGLLAALLLTACGLSPVRTPQAEATFSAHCEAAARRCKHWPTRGAHCSGGPSDADPAWSRSLRCISHISWPGELPDELCPQRVASPERSGGRARRLAAE